MIDRKTLTGIELAVAAAEASGSKLIALSVADLRDLVATARFVVDATDQPRLN
jgi:hypothetical protein